ncbi:hypothetical protein GSI_08511 [Ganoderma sinense ZZ0214-1]|uniref:F-box domain-containing protein n=1 Tax=Ganoderma sinense ZZ0214-1 TaxID=1077348 RepID=A0A2G8S3W0_9APHY|nr:hypothetical protein GSI_08511 [Ganoderma sinense ZZ0214-1]
MAFSYAPRVRRFSSAADVVNFIVASADSPLIALAVRHLTITLHHPIAPQALQQCLSITPNVEDLILFLPPNPPGDILDDVHLPRLQLFKTNLPHQSLLHFLPTHDSLTDLCLGACGRGAEEDSCLLCVLDLMGIVVAECPVSCIRAVAHPTLFRLTGEIDRQSLPNGPAILRSIHAPLASLHALTLDFYPGDYDILQFLVRVVPQLQKLKLLERPGTYHRENHTRRAWNDAARWFASLLQLQWLEELAIRTASSITWSSKGVDREGKTLMRWVARSPRAAKRNARAIEHPALTSLRLWYRTREPAGGILTYWSKSSGVWKNILRATPPPQDTFF